VEFLVNGQPATPAQVKQCQKCADLGGAACAPFKQSSEAQSERRNCAGAGAKSEACAESRKAAAAIDNAKHQAAEQKQKAAEKNNGPTFNTGNSIQVKPLTPTSQTKSNK
jgi:hypothetical protein